MNKWTNYNFNLGCISLYKAQHITLSLSLIWYLYVYSAFWPKMIQSALRGNRGNLHESHSDTHTHTHSNILNEPIKMTGLWLHRNLNTQHYVYVICSAKHLRMDATECSFYYSSTAINFSPRHGISLTINRSRHMRGIE